jgi:2-polyprenyl-3-methyl-5-hydroxy-6-metoxy-1,4-benzoquinol methylase
MRPFYDRYLERLRAEVRDVTGFKPDQPWSKDGLVYQALPWIGIGGDGAQRKTYRRIVELGLDSVVAGVPVLDLGCNMGAMSIAAAEGGASSVLGVELDRRRIGVAERIAAVAGVHDRVRFINGDMLTVLEGLAGAPWEGTVLALAVDAHVPADRLYRALRDINPRTLILESNRCRDPMQLEAEIGRDFAHFEVLGTTEHEDAFANNRLIVRMAR